MLTSSGAMMAASSSRGEWLDMRAGTVVQPGDGELGADHAERLGAAIGNRLVVGDADDERLLSAEHGPEWGWGPSPCLSDRGGGGGAARGREQGCHRAGGEARQQRVRAAGEDDRDARAQHDASGIRAGEKGQAFRQHVAGLEVGHDQHVGAAGNR